MKNKVLFFVTITLLIACNQRKQLNYIEFKVPKDTLIDSLKTATVLLDKMDEISFGNGAACFVVDGQLHYSGKKIGFAVVDMPTEYSSPLPIIESFDRANSIRLFKLIKFLNKNGIDGMVKRWDELCFFTYKQHELNAYNNYEQSRAIVYIKEPKDNYSKYLQDVVILDRYKNILLVAPEPIKPMDSASEMKVTENILKNRDTRKKEKLIGVWGPSFDENASFQIQQDSIYYPEHFKNYKYITSNDSLFILFDGWTYKCKYEFRNDSLFLIDKENVAEFVLIANTY